MADRIDPQHQKHDPRTRSLRDVTAIPPDRPGVEPMTDTERQQWAALEESFLSGMEQTRANAAASCTRANCTCQAVSA